VSKVTMPEPVAWRTYRSKRWCFAYSPNRNLCQCAGDWQGLITTTQAEACANERVREALEAAAKKPREYAMALDKNGWGNRFPEELAAIFNAADNMADRIRSLIPKQ